MDNPTNKQENKQLAQEYAGFRSLIKAVDWFSWKWLAITTGVMVFTSFQQSVHSFFSPTQSLWVLAAIVLIFYMVIDHGLPETLERFIKGRSITLEEKVQKSHKKLLAFMFLFLLVRMFASSTISIWSGGEIGDVTTEDFDVTPYIASAESRDSTDRNKLSVSTNELESLRASEPERLAAAKAKGIKEVKKAISSGNQSQREMWVKNKAYFSPPPSNQYYPQNKAFADRVHQAEANAKAYEEAELSKTLSAQNLVYAVTSDTTSGEYLTSLGNTATSKRKSLEAKEARRTKMIIIVDIMVIIFGLVARIMVINIDIVTNAKKSKKNLSYLIAMAMEKMRVQALQLLEDLLGLDLDGNGHVGSVDNRMKPQQQSIGYAMSGTVTNDAYTSSSPTPRNPIGYKIPNTTTKSVATGSYRPVSENLEKEAKVYKAAYSNANSNLRSWEAKTPVTKRGIITRNKNIKKFKEKKKFAAKELNKLGYDIDLKDGRFILIEL